MKLKKIIQIAIIIFLIITAKSCCSAKYVFEHEEKAFEINIIKDDMFLAEIIEKSNTNTEYENYANNTNTITLKLKISDENGIINNLQDFIILVGNQESQCSKGYQIIEKNENYIIYEIKLDNIIENGELVIKIPENSFVDMIGNKMSAISLKTGIEIDNIAPQAQYSQEILEDGKVLAKITSNEKVRPLEGWKIDESNQINSKEFISDIKYQRVIQDFAGNITAVEIEVKESNFLGFEFLAYISENGWVQLKNNFVGIVQKDNKYKIESIAFRTSKNVSSSFLKGSAYVHSHWGEGSYAESLYSGMIYNYGYNPLSGYKTMQNSELISINNKKFVQIGGEDMNSAGITDINGNNPISSATSTKYLYGISIVKFEVENLSENSILYQPFFCDIGWERCCKNGEEVFISTRRPIEALKIAIIPTSELKFCMLEWDKDIGTYNLK